MNKINSRKSVNRYICSFSFISALLLAICFGFNLEAMNKPLQFWFSRSDRTAEEGQFSKFIFCLFRYVYRNRHVFITGHEHTQ